MKDSNETFSAQETANPQLLKAYGLMKLYEAATGAVTSVQAHDFLPIPELSGDLCSEKNICRFCLKYKKQIEVKNLEDLSASPCAEMHIKAMRESHLSGAYRIYACELGFFFWTSQIYLNGRFSGTLSGGGFSGASGEETRRLMRSLGGEALCETEITRLLESFPRKECRKIKALAELMLICAQFLSVGSEGCHAAMKNREEQRTELEAKINRLKDRYPSGSTMPKYPMEKEQEMIEALRRGDEKTGKELFGDILAFLLFINPEQLRYIQYRAIELAVLLSRADLGPGFASKTILETNNQYIKSIENAVTIDELIGVLYKIFDETVEQTRSFNGKHHISALKKAEYYILDNFTRKLSLDEIARASGFSAPYFSTIFKEEMGENLSNYLNRLRVEKAAYMLRDTDFSLGKIARACGFEDQSWFSKIFKQYTGMSPGRCRNQEAKADPVLPEITFSDMYQKINNNGLVR